VPENLTPGRPAETPGQFLRAWGNLHPTLSALRGMLKAYPAEGARTSAPGLYLDSQRAPWVAVRGEIRVSLARLISVTPDGRHHLVGQVQATASETALDSSCTLRFYLHQPAGVIAREVPDESRWWLDVLDAHYKFGGTAIENLDGVRA
jgi:hypothetical protein